MNNIYKVIWSKAKNCYVVASEIARSHTKSASGSEKIGGVARHALLALGAACAIACGGFVNVGAVDNYVEVTTTGSSTATVYTKDGVDEKINVLAGDVTTNQNAINVLNAKTAKLSADGTKLTDMTAVGGATISGTKVNAGELKVAGQIIDGKGVTTTLADINQSMEQTQTNAKAIGTLQTTTAGQADAIKDLKDRTTNISYDSGKRSTSINGIDIGDTQVDMNGKNLTDVRTINGIDLGTKQKGNYISQDGSIWGNMLEVDDQVKTNADAIAKETADRKAAIGELAVDGKYIKKGMNVSDNLVELDKQAKTNADNIQTNANNIKNNKDEIARVNGELVKTNDYFNKELSKTNDYFNTELGKTNAALQEEGKVRANADAALASDITATNKRTAGIGRTDTGVEADNQTVIEGTVHFDQKGNVSGVKDLKTDTIHATGEIISKGLDAVDGDIKTTGKVSAGDVSTGTLETTGNAKIGGDLTVDGKLNVGEIYMEHKKQESTGEEYDSATSITADGISNRAKVTDKNGNTTESKFTHNEKGTFNYAKDQKITGEWKGSTSNVTADGVSNKMTDSDGNTHTYYQTATETREQLVNGDKSKSNFEKKTAEGNTISITEKDAAGNPKSSLTNTQTVNGEKTSVTNKDSSSTIKQGADQIRNYVASTDGTKSSTEVKADGITNTSDGTITNDANHIENKANTMDTTVTGKATESYGELETTVNGNETHTVTGNQDIHVTGDQTTTITGNKKETVTENVTEDYKKDLTTTVGGNETHEVKGTKTETVEGKLTENFKGGQETNVTGDQTTNVSGTQTINATDINRNASSGMIDTVDNAYGTNKETKVAGSTTTEVSIKGTGESGTYIRGATEARDYIIKGTLSNSETKTAEATSTEITDGNGKTSATIQDKTQISGSVTNGTSSAVSNVKADSIDTAVIEGTNTSLISQKKDSITSAVGNDTTSTVIQQGEKDITIASNGGTVGIAGKDIINNATNEITNTAGTKITDKVGNNTRVIDQTSITDTVGTASRKIEDGKITDTAGDSTVTTENGKGTTFAKAGSAAYSTEAGAPTDTNIAGNHITTGRVDANELGVSDKDDQGNTADFSVKAGKGIKGSVTDKDGNKTYTTVTATENSFQVQDKDGNIKNHQVNTKDKSENTIKNGDKTNTVISTADGTSFINSKAAAPVTGASGAGTHLNTTIKGNTINTGKVTMDYAEVMKDLGVHGSATVDNDLTVKGITNTKTLNVTEDAKVGRNLAVDGNATIAGDVTARSYKVDGKTYIDANGINANNQKITNVADGSISEGSKDAVNGGQLYTVKNDLEGKVNKVGANAAAMANLHPMEFDPDSKWNIAAAMGNYGSETATAIGAFYRPNEDVMVNFSTAFGTGENMVGGGVSVRLGKGGNKLSREETNALKAQVNDLTARMDALLSVLNPNMSKDFPDVPENHWAYEAVSRLAGNDIVQGYPDGEFHGERTMTRYEMAEIIYNALSRGAEAEKELVEEFKPELQAMAASEKATAERAEG